jgi:hypothetical protein
MGRQWQDTVATAKTRLFGERSLELANTIDDTSGAQVFRATPAGSSVVVSLFESYVDAHGDLFESYVDAYGDLNTAFNNGLKPGKSKAEFGQWHYCAYGNAEGRTSAGISSDICAASPLDSTALIIKSNFESSAEWRGRASEKLIGGYLLPRLFTVPYAVVDPKGEITRSATLKQGEQKVFQSAVFINEDISKDKETSDAVWHVIREPDEVRLKETNDLIDVGEEFVKVDWDQSSIRTNILLEDEEDCSIGSVERCVVGEDRSLELNDVLRKAAPGQPGVKLLDSKRTGWVEMDFGENMEVAINRVKMSYENSSEARFGERAVHLYGSHTGESWSRVGWFMHTNADRSIPEQTLYREINDQKYRYYKIEIEPGMPDLEVRHLMQMSFGYFGRKINSAPIREISIPISLLSFKNQGPTEDGENLIFSYYINRKHGVDITTNPQLSFVYRFNVEWENEDGSSGAELKPTWANEWHDSNLFQVSYQNPGYLEISVPIKDVKKYRKRVVQFTVTTI